MELIECGVCGCEFEPTIERHYISRDEGKTGMSAAFGSNDEVKLYDTFDCHACGCQVIAKTRKREYKLDSREVKRSVGEDER